MLETFSTLTKQMQSLAAKAGPETALKHYVIHPKDVTLADPRIPDPAFFRASQTNEQNA
jgi:hypothetical protein